MPLRVGGCAPRAQSVTQSHGPAAAPAMGAAGGRGSASPVSTEHWQIGPGAGTARPAASSTRGDVLLAQGERPRFGQIGGGGG